MRPHYECEHGQLTIQCDKCAILALTAENAELLAQLSGNYDGPQMAQKILRLQAENAALRKDAERYRWLRDRAWPFEFQGNTPEDADAAIDAEMAKRRKHTPSCSYWDGLFAQVCNCDAAMGEKP